MKISIIEANMTGWQHVPINSHIINIISSIFPTEDIHLFCSKEHYNNLDINRDKIKYENITIVSNKKQRIKKFFLEYRQTLTILKRNNSDLFILLSCYPNVQVFLTILLKHNKNKKVILITHGEMEGLRLKGKWKFWSYPFWVFLCTLINPSTNFTRIVLGENIANNMKKYKNFQNVLSLNHPLQICDTKYISPTKYNNVFAFIGTCLVSKGGNTIVSSALSLNKNSNSYFEIIGTYDEQLENKTDNIHFATKKGIFLEKNDYQTFVKNITYACLPYPKDSYKYTASGSLLDAIAFLKPIIYIGNDYFDCIFKDAGDVGYRCENEEDFIKQVLFLDETPDLQRYEKQVLNLQKLRETLSIKQIETDFKNILVTKLL